MSNYDNYIKLRERIDAKMFSQYSNKIANLQSFNKADILIKNFELYNNKNISIYYAPHNEIINKDAKIFIVGITPGWTQTSIAYEIAHKGLINNLDEQTIKLDCKRSSRFAGSMRKNLIEMLDELDLNKKLNISSCLELFTTKDDLLHTTSIIPYPVFINGKNYTGHNPNILENEILTSYVNKYFCNEVKILSNALFIPLGKAVEEVLQDMVDKKLLSKNQILFGFPHPSGANGHRKKQFEINKASLIDAIKNYFNNNF